MATILAIDPGFRRTGWVVVDVHGDGIIPVECGLIETQKATGKVLVAVDDWECCRIITRELIAVACIHEARCIVVEAPAGSKSSRAAKCMALAFACCAAVAEVYERPAVLVSADRAKKAATGRRNASKDDVAAAVAHLLPPDWGDPWPRSKREHITDAAALVLGAWESDVVRMVRAL